MKMEANTIQREILNRFRKITHRHANFLANIIELVANGLKLGYIWDISYIVNHQQITELLVALREQNLLKNELIAFKLFDDIGFCNKYEVLKSTGDRDSLLQNYTFIDISARIERPIVLAKTHELYNSLFQMISEIRSQFQETDNFVEIILDDSKYCIPTAFGFLAGYPIVYWYENPDRQLITDEQVHDNELNSSNSKNTSKSGANCLNNVENFNIYKVFNKEVLLFQFSCPKNLIDNSEVKRSLEDWLQGFSGPSLRVEVITQVNTNAITL